MEKPIFPDGDYSRGLETRTTRPLDRTSWREWAPSIVEGDSCTLGGTLNERRWIPKETIQPCDGYTWWFCLQRTFILLIYIFVSNVALQCQTYSRLEDVHIGGFVLYTGTEEAGRQAAGVFAGSQLILDIVNEKQADLKALIDYLTTIVK